MNIMKWSRFAFVLAVVALPVCSARADNAGPQNSKPLSASPNSGATIYANVCQACHMENARGATGAATIPALAGNEHLNDQAYPIYVVLYGRGAMPAFGKLLNDDQIAAVLNYVRTNFGNHFPGSIASQKVKSSRIASKQYAGGY